MVFSIELHAGSDPAWLDCKPGMKQDALDYANKILRDLEDSGMLPPPKELENVTGIIKYYHSFEEIEEDVTYHTNPRVFWESEE